MVSFLCLSTLLPCLLTSLLLHNEHHLCLSSLQNGSLAPFSGLNEKWIFCKNESFIKCREINSLKISGVGGQCPMLWCTDYSTPSLLINISHMKDQIIGGRTTIKPTGLCLGGWKHLRPVFCFQSLWHQTGDETTGFHGWRVSRLSNRVVWPRQKLL